MFSFGKIARRYAGLFSAGLLFTFSAPSGYPLVLPFSSVARAAAEQVADIVTAGVDEVAATQSEVGHTAVTKMMNFWADEAKGDPKAFEKYLAEKVLAKPFPGVVGPSLWGEKGPRTYILDGHHRASAINRILFDPYDLLPTPVKQMMTRERQLELRALPEMKMRVQVEARYATAEELAKEFALSGRGQLPAEVRRYPSFARALAKLLAKDPSAKPNALVKGYSQMARTLSLLRDSPLRSAVGNAFYTAGIDSANMINYVEFFVAENIAPVLYARGIRVTKENAISPEIEREVQRAILEDRNVKNFLYAAARPGQEKENKAMLDVALAKYKERHPRPTPPVPCPDSYLQLAE